MINRSRKRRGADSLTLEQFQRMKDQLDKAEGLVYELADLLIIGNGRIPSVSDIQSDPQHVSNLGK